MVIPGHVIHVTNLVIRANPEQEDQKCVEGIASILMIKYDFQERRGTRGKKLLSLLFSLANRIMSMTMTHPMICHLHRGQHQLHIARSSARILKRRYGLALPARAAAAALLAATPSR